MIPSVLYENGATRQLGYLKISVDPENNTATAQEVFVAYVEEKDSIETPHVYDPPIVEEAITFQLKPSDISQLDDDNDDDSCFISIIR